MDPPVLAHFELLRTNAHQAAEQIRGKSNQQVPSCMCV